MIDLNFVPGDIVRVFQKIQEGEKTRIQVFEGVVLDIKGRGENKSFSVQKMVGDVAVERTWPIMSPMLDKVVLKGKYFKAKKVRKSHLSFLRKTKKNN